VSINEAPLEEYGSSLSSILILNSRRSQACGAQTGGRDDKAYIGTIEHAEESSVDGTTHTVCSVGHQRLYPLVDDLTFHYLVASDKTFSALARR
jgi:hypothetical protein